MRLLVMGAALWVALSNGVLAASSIEIAATADTPSSGRLLVFAQAVKPGEAAPDAVDTDEFSDTGGVFVAARELSNLHGGDVMAIDGRDKAFPSSLDALPAGDYWVQAVLDADHSYAYSGRGEGDAVSKVVKISLPVSGAPTILLDSVLPVQGFWEVVPGHLAYQEADKPDVVKRIRPFAFKSSKLSAFWGRDIAMRGIVVTPPGYDSGHNRYPVVYFTTGFAAGMHSLTDTAVSVMRLMRDERYPPMIWVLLDQSSATGTHEFADSVNNGPWGAALTGDLIPWLDAQYRTDGRASGRFVMGHSSGGWAALWLQIIYPKIFGGAWATSPDFSDFHHFGNTDISAPGAVMTNVTFAQVEAVLGDYGGQASSFEWVFSPRGADGRAMPLYDRATGKVDPVVAAYWLDHHDLARIIRDHWPALRPDIDGKIHVYVGTKDDYGLDKAASYLEAAFKDVGGHASFTYIEGRGHYNLYAEGDERMALRRHIAWQMWKAARPKSALSDPAEAK